MRRSRFAKAIESGAQVRERASLGEALWFDIVAPDNAGDEALSDSRGRSFDHCGLLLGATHLLVLAVFLSFHPHPLGSSLVGSPMLPAVGTLMIDVIAALALHFRHRWEVAPHLVVRGLCIYLASTGLLWLLFANQVASGSGAEEASAAMAILGAGMAVAAVVAVDSPALALVNLAIAALAAAICTHSPMVGARVAGVAAILLAYSIAGARTIIASGRKRQKLDHEARKAVRFVDEFENSGRGWFWETNAQGTLSYVSQQLADDFQCEPEALLGHQFTDLMSVDKEHGVSVGEESKTLGFHLSARFPFSDVVVRPASEADVHWSLSGNPIFDERGRFLGFRGIGTDLTEQRRSEQEITRLARFDSLTGLPNRALMRQTLDEALRNAASRRKGCALFLIDLDRFKNVNDTLGHPIGDALLKEVATRLKSVLGDHGQVGRLGGDEFKAVLPGVVDIGLLESLARTLIDHVSRPYMIEGHKVTIGASLGIAIGDPGRSNADSLIRNADLALYAAKGGGRGQHRIYEASMHSEASDRQVLENDLRQALDRDELWVAFQPIVRAASEEICGFEALVRWNHPVRGPISPDKFIPIAEECGMIRKIGSWVLKQALSEAANWPDGVRVAVNLSPIQFNDPGIVETIGTLIQESGIRAQQVELEITEGVFLSDSPSTDETFAGLKGLGVRLALDDFGTGYSSLGYLKKAPFDKIKIDQSFVRGAASSTNRNGAIIRAIVTLAETLGMDTTAEGVETHDDLNLIRELGCSQIQGFIFGRPMPAAEARELAMSTSVEADGFQCTREPRQRLMRRAIAQIGGKTCEIRLRNISARGALVECPESLSPGTQMTIDIVGAGPVLGTVRWSQKGKFGVQFIDEFDLARLAPKKERGQEVTMLRPWYVDQKVAS
ncbi:MAG: EAL domain-containing protein [Sphingomicrobium sp.]